MVGSTLDAVLRKARRLNIMQCLNNTLSEVGHEPVIYRLMLARL